MPAKQERAVLARGVGHTTQTRYCRRSRALRCARAARGAGCLLQKVAACHAALAYLFQTQVIESLARIRSPRRRPQARCRPTPFLCIWEVVCACCGPATTGRGVVKAHGPAGRCPILTPPRAEGGRPMADKLPVFSRHVPLNQMAPRFATDAAGATRKVLPFALLTLAAGPRASTAPASTS